MNNFVIGVCKQYVIFSTRGLLIDVTRTASISVYWWYGKERLFFQNMNKIGFIKHQRLTYMNTWSTNYDVKLF